MRSMLSQSVLPGTRPAQTDLATARRVHEPRERDTANDVPDALRLLLADTTDELNLRASGRAHDAHAQVGDRGPAGDVAQVGENRGRDSAVQDSEGTAIDGKLRDRRSPASRAVKHRKRHRGDTNNKEDRQIHGSDFLATARESGFKLSEPSVSTHAFFDDAAKAAVSAAIERVESQTSAEIVVAVRRQAGASYSGADLGFGALVALASLTLLLFVDKEFATTWIPVDVAGSFALGAILCRYTWFLRRLFVPSARRTEETRRAASTAFHEAGIGRTSGRNGVLVLVALFEHRVAVIPDVGIDPVLIQPSIANLRAAIERPVPDFDAFLAALESFGPALSKAMPRRDDDVNELPDEVGVA